jgi:WD40 repeat protein
LNTVLITSFGIVVTAGDDCTVRTWVTSSASPSLPPAPETATPGKKSKTDKNTTTVVPGWIATRVFELKDHSSPISALSEHPSEPWVCSAGKDGACKIWNIKMGTLLMNIPFLIEGIPNFDPNKTKMECRGCK